jgi:hypothetical protein
MFTHKYGIAEPLHYIGTHCETLFKNSACWEAIKPPLDKFDFIYPRVSKHYGLAQMNSVFIQPYNHTGPPFTQRSK